MQLMAVVEQALLAKTGKLTSLTPNSMAACCCSPGPGRLFLIGGRHNPEVGIIGMPTA